MFQSVQKIKKLDWPNFTAEPDVEFSGFSKDINIVSIGWEPAAVLNVKHVARRFNAFLTSRYSAEMDVEFNCLSNDNTNIFGGWEPAVLFNCKHDATEK